MKVIDPKSSLEQNRLVLRHQQRWDMGTTYGFRLPTGALSFHKTIRRRLALLAGLALSPILSSLETMPGIDVPTDRLIRARLVHNEPQQLAQKLQSQLPHPFRVKDQGLGRFFLSSSEIPLEVVILPSASALQACLSFDN
ncbi:MAG: hypothetical protein CMH58_00195 [Myxococcales bacterium]|jgi:hypothetical protein|nr:hypothetical protein [Myxococcales bacterium]|tara:strand:- start:9085 stop:9504 length:420 start_codon:yes stop_codon:yes gene_type:complete